MSSEQKSQSNNEGKDRMAKVILSLEYQGHPEERTTFTIEGKSIVVLGFIETFGRTMTSVLKGDYHDD